MNGNTATLSPVTEEEMRAFFNRLISTIVESTRTHSELESLKQRFSELQDKVNALVSENESLRRERYTIENERDRLKLELQDAKQLGDSYAKDSDRWRELYRNERDHRDNVEQQLKEANAKLAKAEGLFKEWFGSQAPQANVARVEQEQRTIPRFEDAKQAVQDIHPVQATEDHPQEQPKDEEKPAEDKRPWWERDKNELAS